MTPIQMVDLKGQYARIKSEVDEAIHQVLDSTQFIGGTEVKLFQSELESFLGVKHVIPCANGTDALQIAMMALDLKPGDEVITAAFTYVATAEIISLLKLKPVLVDVDPRTFNLDTEQIIKAITTKTKAIVPVHLFGQCANMEAVLEIAKKYNLFVVEDTAQAIDADFTFSNGRAAKAGCMGHIGTTSFFPSKNLGCYGDGGALFTNDDDLAMKIRMIANHGQKVRYYHEVVGVNSRLDTIQAAILRVKLKHLKEYSEARNAVARFYDDSFRDVPQLTIPYRLENSTHVFHQYTLIAEGVDRSGLLDYLSENGIPAMIYYPVPLHLQNAFKSSEWSEGSFPVTEWLCSRVFSLPMHTELSQEQLNFIVTKVKEGVSKHLI
jgi:dTDP-4-amino-4,6-dideoxygalactose transaminase